MESKLPASTRKQLNGQPVTTKLELSKHNLRLFNEKTAPTKTTAKNGVKPQPKAARKLPTGSGSGTPKRNTEDGTTPSCQGRFLKALSKHGVLLEGNSITPDNLREIRDRLSIPRATPSPTQSEHGVYSQAMENVPNEATTFFHLTDNILKRDPDDEYITVLNKAFNNLPKKLKVNVGLSAPVPDYIQGLTWYSYTQGDTEAFDPEEHLNCAVLYTDDTYSVTLPQIAGEVKFKNQSLYAAQVQASYAAAVLVYARKEALAYMSTADPVHHAKITTFHTNGEKLRIFAHHEAPWADGKAKYHQTEVKSFNLMEYDGFKEGRKWLRNQQDYAKELSLELKDQLLDHWERFPDGLPPIVNGATPTLSAQEQVEGAGTIPVPSLEEPSEDLTDGEEAGETGEDSDASEDEDGQGDTGEATANSICTQCRAYNTAQRVRHSTPVIVAAVTAAGKDNYRGKPTPARRGRPPNQVKEEGNPTPAKRGRPRNDVKKTGKSAPAKRGRPPLRAQETVTRKAKLPGQKRKATQDGERDLDEQGQTAKRRSARLARS